MIKTKQDFERAIMDTCIEGLEGTLAGDVDSTTADSIVKRAVEILKLLAN